MEIKSYKERFADKVKREEFFDDAFAHVACGGTLIQYARSHGIRYGDLTRFIRKHEVLSSQYDAALEDRKEWIVESVLDELKKLALSDIRGIFDDNGGVLNVEDWPEDMSAAVQSIDMTELVSDGVKVGVNKRVKFWDKLKAIELIGKNKRLFTDRVEVESTNRLEDLIIASMSDGSSSSIAPKGTHVTNTYQDGPTSYQDVSPDKAKLEIVDMRDDTSDEGKGD